MRKIIIVGCGRLGRMLSTRLSQEGHNVCVVDGDADKLSQLPAEFIGDQVKGVGYDIDVLKSANADTADIVIAVTDDDTLNIMAAQVARAAFNVPRVITRVFEPIKAETYRTLGLESVCTTTALCGIFHDLVSRNGNHSVLPSDHDLVLVERTIGPGFVWESVEALETKRPCRVVCVLRDGRVLFPRDSGPLTNGDRAVVAVSRRDVESLSAP